MKKGRKTGIRNRGLWLLLILLMMTGLFPVGALAESDDPLAGLAALGEFTPPEPVEQ